MQAPVNSGVSKAKPKPSAAPTAHHVFMAMIVEVGGLAILYSLAGLSPGMANIGLLIIAGLWLMFLIFHASEVKNLSNWLTRTENL